MKNKARTKYPDAPGERLQGLREQLQDGCLPRHAPGFRGMHPVRGMRTGLSERRDLHNELALSLVTW